jgi:hypothetical protein
MIFASDLDRTLIYSEKFLKDYPHPVKIVEDGRYTSAMTARAAELLLAIAGLTTFVPCTTRTVEQYRRINFFQQECLPKYAVVSNGGNIIVDGAVDPEYRSRVGRELEDACLPAPHLLQEFQKVCSGDWAAPLKCADELFYYCIIDVLAIPAELKHFGLWVSEQNWQMSVQGRKLYLVPGVISKWSALEKVKEMTGQDMVIAAGDSLLDLPLLKNSNYAVFPAHGEIYEHFNQLTCNNPGNISDAYKTKASGLSAGEEILDILMEKILSGCL